MEHTTFSNRTILFEDLPQWENVDMNKISPRYSYIVLINIIISTLIVLGFVILFGVVNTKSEFPLLTWILLIGGIVLFFMILTAINLIALKRRGYAVREKDIIYASGILAHTTLVIPFKNIQHVEIKESFFERKLNLASIRLFTAGAGTNMQISGIDKENALVLQTYLSERISSRNATESNHE